MANNRALHKACAQATSLNHIKKLVGQCSNINQLDSEKHTPLYYAMLDNTLYDSDTDSKRALDIVKYLLKKGAALTQSEVNVFIEIFLFYDADSNLKEAFKTLFDHYQYDDYNKDEINYILQIDIEHDTLPDFNYKLRQPALQLLYRLWKANDLDISGNPHLFIYIIRQIDQALPIDLKNAVCATAKIIQNSLKMPTYSESFISLLVEDSKSYLRLSELKEMINTDTTKGEYWVLQETILLAEIKHYLITNDQQNAHDRFAKLLRLNADRLNYINQACVSNARPNTTFLMPQNNLATLDGFSGIIDFPAWHAILQNGSDAKKMLEIMNEILITDGTTKNIPALFKKLEAFGGHLLTITQDLSLTKTLVYFMTLLQLQPQWPTASLITYPGIPGWTQFLSQHSQAQNIFMALLGNLKEHVNNNVNAFSPLPTSPIRANIARARTPATPYLFKTAAKPQKPDNKRQLSDVNNVEDTPRDKKRQRTTGND